MRALLIEQILPDMGVSTEVTDIEVDMIGSASEMFICNAVTGITAISEVSGIAHWSEAPRTGLVQDKLIERYRCFGG